MGKLNWFQFVIQRATTHTEKISNVHIGLYRFDSGINVKKAQNYICWKVHDNGIRMLDLFVWIINEKKCNLRCLNSTDSSYLINFIVIIIVSLETQFIDLYVFYKCGNKKSSQPVFKMNLREGGWFFGFAILQGLNLVNAANILYLCGITSPSHHFW